MSVKDRGFGSMNKEKQQALASKGGKTAHEKGTAREWTREEAIAAGKKGGKIRAENAKRKREAAAVDASSTVV